MTKGTSLFFGILSVVVGIEVLLTGGWSYSKFEYFFDYSPFQYEFGGFFLICGILFFLYGIWGKRTYPEKKIEVFLICPQCEETYSSEKITDGKCPHCSVKLELLEGYFARKNAALKNE